MTVRLAILFILLVGTIHTTHADMGSPGGYVTVQNRTVLTIAEDLSDYRFFVVFANVGRELTLSERTETAVPSINAGPYVDGKLIAVPRSAVSNYPNVLADGQMETLARTLDDEKIPGAIRLLGIKFTRDVRRGEESSVKGDRYKVIRTANSLTAIPQIADVRTNHASSVPGWFWAAAIVVFAFAALSVHRSVYANRENNK
jgi:hypothetical protein